MIPEWNQTLSLLVVEVEELVVTVVDTNNPEAVVYTGASDIVVAAAAELYKEHIGLA
jgi:hypothetical protein